MVTLYYSAYTVDKIDVMAIIEANKCTHKFISIKGTKMSGNDNTSNH